MCRKKSEYTLINSLNYILNTLYICAIYILKEYIKNSIIKIIEIHIINGAGTLQGTRLKLYISNSLKVISSKKSIFFSVQTVVPLIDHLPIKRDFSGILMVASNLLFSPFLLIQDLKQRSIRNEICTGKNRTLILSIKFSGSKQSVNSFEG